MNPSTLTLNEAIRKAAEKLAESGITTARLDAELLLAHILKKDRTWIFTHLYDALDPENDKAFQELLERRTLREPFQYIIGKQEFWGLEFMVTPDVLIPRPETELVVEAAIEAVAGVAGPRLIDVCTGSGCIAISLAAEVAALRIFATDRSDPALAVARQNARMHRVTDRIRFVEGDLFEPLQEMDLHGGIDVITANPPYIPTGDRQALQPEVRDFEPGMALFAGVSGSEIQQRIIQGAPDFLKKHGKLIMEMGIGQAETLSSMAEATGRYERPQILKDLAGIDRTITLQRK